MELRDFETQLRGGRLTTAEVLYYMPDHPSLLQRFMWQTLDVAPARVQFRNTADTFH